VANQSQATTREKMILAVYELVWSGMAVSSISGHAVTEYCSVDKMYVNRYFGDLPGLYLATIEYLLTVRMNSMISTDVFPMEGEMNLDPNIEVAFKLATFMSGQQEHKERLTQIGRIVTAVYAKQLERNFDVDESRAIQEAKFGIMFIAGFLSIGNVLELDSRVLHDFLDRRRDELKRGSGSK
jgi:hypothetical protein